MDEKFLRPQIRETNIIRVFVICLFVMQRPVFLLIRCAIKSSDVSLYDCEQYDTTLFDARLQAKNISFCTVVSCTSHCLDSLCVLLENDIFH